MSHTEAILEPVESTLPPNTSADSRSIFEGTLPLHEKLEKARVELLDMSMRNRLLSIPRSKGARFLDIVDENSAEIYRLLVRENRAFSFLPGKASDAEAATVGDDEELVELAQPEDDSVDERGILSRHADTKLQTRLTSQGLQKRLLDFYIDARTLEEEQGVNSLFLALGMLKWVDPASTKGPRYAPLILVPVNVERASAGERFKLKWSQEDPSSNLSLEAYLERIHKLALPAFAQDDDFDVTTYLGEVARAIQSKPGWEVLRNDIALSFFSFAKFLMYRDLDSSAWPEGRNLADRPLLRGLLRDGFQAEEDLIGDDEFIDTHLAPSDIRHIIDADGSQTLAINDVRCGRDLIIQGPPGTGKSQTIANIIAGAVADGKKVLFVAEKMAALEVVKRRLDSAGVGDACLELHSNRANKRAFLEELRRTWELGAPRGNPLPNLNARLLAARDTLNGHVARMHRTHPMAGLTPYQVIGHLTRLQREGQLPNDFHLDGVEKWTGEDKAARTALLNELIARIHEIGTPAQHPWRDVALEVILPPELERLKSRMANLLERLEAIIAGHAAMGRTLELEAPVTFAELDELAAIAERIAHAPDIASESLAAPEWNSEMAEIEKLIEAGKCFNELHADLQDTITATALNTPVLDIQAELASLPADFSLSAFERVAQLRDLLPSLIAEAERLRPELGIDWSLDTLDAIDKACKTGERVSCAPEASAEAFTATVWDHGLDRANDLAEAVATLEQSRASLRSHLTDAAWQHDLTDARATLARHGTGFFRYFSGSWRAANNLVKSVLTTPETPLSVILKCLDTLAQGQVALEVVRSNDTFGRSAFGDDWRGDRTASPPLQALVAWMQSLRGLGAEPRIIASRVPDKAQIGERALLVMRLLEQIRPLANGFWNDLGASATRIDERAAHISRLPLATFLAKVTSIADADTICHHVIQQIPGCLTDRIDLLSRITNLQKLEKSIFDKNELAGATFSPCWNGKETDWGSYADAVGWMQSNRELQSIASKLDDRRRPDREAREARTLRASFLTDYQSLLSQLKTNSNHLFSREDIENVSLSQIAQRLMGWLGAPEQLSKWIAYQNQATRARQLGLTSLVDVLASGRLLPDAALSSFEIAYYEAILAEQIKDDPELGRFDGQAHTTSIREFVDLDEDKISATRFEVTQAHHRGLPPNSGVGAVGILRGEMARKRGHMPIRQLMQRAAPVIQAIKPVMMMSPLSVAQFLPPGQLTFDLLVMDEASQIQPVDALGAVARCDQVVVVGDERQLPPTRFFAKVTESDDNDDDSGAGVADIESILGLFTARGLRQRMLRWHYRSRHQSLIAISNTSFYENKLYIVPSPYTQEGGMGLRFHYIDDGVFDSGNTRVNTIEAKRIAEAIIHHARTSPELSLGVATFSVNQRRTINDHLELLRRQNPDCESFFSAHPNEPFFIKNLENIQGDERDVIMISVGYAKNASGYMAMRFGPLSAEGGERRLNVLISRAKQRCEVYSSITDEDIDLERSKGAGVVAFKLFLAFARTGRLAIPKVSGKGYDSPFEVQVAQSLMALGYQVHPQVGIAGFFIDLAIADPELPGRYLLGIECDGVAYHSSRSARDRDRARQSVLEDHGWIIHRIWSTDWFQRPTEQLQKVVESIDSARTELDIRARQKRDRAVSLDIVTIDRHDVVEVSLMTSDAASTFATPYVESSPAAIRRYELQETPPHLMANVIQDIVTVEGPIHVDEVVVRARLAWNLQRTGNRIQQAVEDGINVALQQNRVQKNNHFLSIPNSEIKIRDRSNVRSATLRKPEMLPPEEIKCALQAILKMSFGAERLELVQAVSRILGFKATSTQLREVIELGVDDLLSQGVLRLQGQMITIAEVNM